MKLKFAMATNDAYQCVLEAFLGAGWQLDKLFISPGNWMYDSKQVIARALELGAPIQYSPVNDHDLADLGKRGCDALVVSGYAWKIPPWDAYLKYALNFHPSPLPEGRGPYPLVRAILEGRSSWAVSCHKINDKFDQGEILAIENFSLDRDEYHHSLRLKVQMAATRLAARVAREFESSWQGALAQGSGTYWHLWSDQDRFLDFTEPVAAIMRKVRAFGDLECLVTINEATVFIHRANGWIEAHSATPGTIVHGTGLEFVIAAADGYIAISEWSFNAPGAITAKMRY